MIKPNVQLKPGPQLRPGVQLKPGVQLRGGPQLAKPQQPQPYKPYPNQLPQFALDQKKQQIAQKMA